MGDALSRLVNSLQNNPIEEFKNILEQARITTKEVKNHCFFSEHYYTRNLVYAEDTFELIVLCWNGKQQTPIHDHNNSDGWLSVIQGGVTETIYAWDKNTREAKIQDVISNEELGSGAVSHVNDDIGVHSICNPDDGESITLHLYSPRILKCHYVDHQSAAIKEKVLSFHSIGGKLVKSS
ncbi:MAG: cysteine dioxygenase family protein [Oligoflexales bacterium]